MNFKEDIKTAINLSLQDQTNQQLYNEHINDLTCSFNKTICDLKNENNRIIQQMDINKKNPINLTCQICLEGIYNKNIHTNNCKHTYCIDCTRDHIKISINNSIIDIKCPKNGCNNYYTIGEIYNIVDYDTFEKYKRLQVILHNNIAKKEHKFVNCPNCDTFVMNNNKKTVKCYDCEHKFCFDCQINHKDMTCKKYIKKLEQWKKQNDNGDKLFKKIIKKYELKKCPKCKYLINKLPGCDHMHCGHCKKDFSWERQSQVKNLKKINLKSN